MEDNDCVQEKDQYFNRLILRSRTIDPEEQKQKVEKRKREVKRAEKITAIIFLIVLFLIVVCMGIVLSNLFVNIYDYYQRVNINMIN